MNQRDALLGRVGLIATGAYLLLSAELAKWTGAQPTHDEVVIGTMSLYLFAFALFLIAAVGSNLLKYAGELALAGLLVGVGISVYSTIAGIGEGDYFFDVMPLTHRSAELILDGDNPYAIRENQEFIRDTARRFNSPLFTFTREGDGELIDQLVTYPAGHLFTFLPFVALGLNDLRWVTLAGLMLVMVALWKVAPVYLRPFVGLPVVIHTVFVWGISLGGLTDVMWLLPLMAMVYALHTKRMGWAAVFYGVAASMRQQAWLLAPFLLIWLWKTSDEHLGADHKAKQMLQPVLVSAGVFFLINLPFIIWSPGDWFHGVTYLVFTDHGTWGVGIAETRYLGVHGGHLLFTILPIAVMAVLLTAYTTRFEQLQHSVWAFPLLILFFIQRPLWYYFIPWFLLLEFALLLPLSSDEGQPVPEASPELAARV